MTKRSRVATMSALMLATLSATPLLAAENPIADPVVRLSGDDSADFAQNSTTGPTSNSNATGGSSSGLRVNPSNNTVGGQNLSGANAPELPRSGPLYDVGTFLLDHGVDFHPFYVDHFFANPTAGAVPGQTYNLGAFEFNADFNLQKLVVLPGGFVHFSYSQIALKSNIPQIISDAGGFLTGYQTTPALSDTKISELTYEQRLFSDDLSIEAGRTNLYRYFLLNNSLDPFNNVSSTLSIDGDIVPFINPTWGGRVKYYVEPALYLQAGAFEDYWRRSIVRPWNLDTDGASGAQVIGEVGYRTEFNTAAYPANFEAGLEWNTRDGYGNFKGTARPATVTVVVRGRTITEKFTAADYGGGGVLFAQGKRVLWRAAQGTPGAQPENIAVYGSLALSVDKPQPVDGDVIAGVDFTGFIPTRPNDALELQVHYQRLSALEANFETAQQDITQGIGRSQSRDNYAFQATGNIQLLPSISLRPYAQLFINPDEYYVPTERAANGWGAGFTAVIAFGQLLGLSSR